ncbi:phage head-tail adapter protein [Streptomyces cavourensis]|nr:phage head-tail adapter protein [Streptomyces cavourensis]
MTCRRAACAEFEGIPQATLRQWLVDALQAQQDLMTGAKGESYSYSQGEGSKSVSFSRTNLNDLAVYIRRLQACLSGRGRGGPMRPFF